MSKQTKQTKEMKVSDESYSKQIWVGFQGLNS